MFSMVGLPPGCVGDDGVMELDEAALIVSRTRDRTGPIENVSQ